MSAPKISTWRYLRNVVGPIALAFLVTVGAVAGFVLLSIDHTDDAMLTRQSTLLQLALHDRVLEAGYAQTDLAAWDEALIAYQDGDTEWFAEEFGTEGFDYYHQSRIYVLDSDLTPFFAMRDGGEIAPTSFAAIQPLISPLIQALRTEERQAALSAYKAGNREAPPVQTDIGLVDGQPAILSVAPLVAEDHNLNAAPGMEPLYVAVTMLDATVANDLADRYLLSGVRFDDDGTLAIHEAAIALNNAQGEPAVWLKWLPDRPGESILSDTLPALGAALLVLTLIIGLLLRNLLSASDQLHAERADAQHRALHDPLTGLGNRALFRDRLDSAFRTMEHTAPCLALLALDLDRFKQVNDNYGHEAGDELLRQVASRIITVLRPTDTLVRLGGDEFAILQTGITSAEDATGLANRILSAVRAPYHLGDNVAEIGVSIGIVTAPDHARSENELVTRADDALYRAKAGGRNRYCVHAGDRAAEDTPQRLQDRVGDAMIARGAA